MGLFVATTIVFASTTVYESVVRTTLTSTSTETSVTMTTSTTTQTTTVTSTFDLIKATKTLTDAYLSHIGAIESRNATALANQFETNATLLYSSPNGVVFGSGLNGSVNGIANILGFYARNKSQADPCVTCFLIKPPFSVANQTWSSVVSNDETGNVTSHLVFYGTLSYGDCYAFGVGSCNTIYYAMGFGISFVLQDYRWLISTESLTYIDSSTCTTAYGSLDGGNAFHCEFSSG